MNDDVLPPDTPGDQLEAVNAVLDGLATDDQRARVDASPQLTELLAAFQADRRALAQVPVPDLPISDQVRESHIAAALAAFDDVHVSAVAPAADTARATSVATAAPSNVVPIARHRRMYRTLLGAAAAVVLVVGGVAALNSQSGDSDQDSAATAADAKVGGDQAATLDAPAPELADTAAGTADGSATQSAEASTAMTEDAAAPVQTDAPAAPAETSAAADTSAVPRSTIGSIGPEGAEAPQPIADEGQLRSYVAAPPAADDAQTVPACGPADNDDLGNVSYQGTLAVVVRDPDTGQVEVYALDDCTLLTTLQT